MLLEYDYKKVAEFLDCVTKLVGDLELEENEFIWASLQLCEIARIAKYYTIFETLHDKKLTQG